MKSWVFACLTVGLLGIVSAGCDSEDNPIEKLDEASDCKDICKKYQSCFDKGYDVDKCEDNCEDRADDPDHKGQEDKCSDCVNDASCAGAVFSCTDDCVGIVP